jgi:C1A family cysteine protease
VSSIVATSIDASGPLLGDEDAKMPITDQYWDMFEAFMVEHKRMYSSPREKLKKFANFRENMLEAEWLNDMHNGTAEFGPTIFSDMSKQEFINTILSPRSGKQLPELNATKLHVGQYTPTKNWVTEKKVTPIRHQLSCGSCWAHCSLGEIESRLLIRGNPAYSLSVQQLVDCDRTSYGCDGGFENAAMVYVFTNGGVMQEANYRYTGVRGTCRYSARTDNIKLPSRNVYQPASTDPTAVYDFIYNHGPSTSAMDATLIQNYRGGIFNVPSSSCPSINHCVMIVGYDSTQNYFLIKNSWGTSWGEQGYIRINSRSCMVNVRIYGSSA